MVDTGDLIDKILDSTPLKNEEFTQEKETPKSMYKRLHGLNDEDIITEDMLSEKTVNRIATTFCLSRDKAKSAILED